MRMRLYVSLACVTLMTASTTHTGHPTVLFTAAFSTTSILPRSGPSAAFLSPSETTQRTMRNVVEPFATRRPRQGTRMFLGDDDDEDDDDDEEDWRAFRAKLVMGESKDKKAAAVSTTKTATSKDDTEVKSFSGEVVDDDLDGIGSLFQDDFSEIASSTSSSSTTSTTQQQSSEEKADEKSSITPLDPSQWAYDSGDVIEQGAVILGGVEQEFGFGLRQQYFHKALILVLDHEESVFTKGILLNRPTDLLLEDDINPGKKWRVWFGGDVQGIHSQRPDITCLHSIKDPRATKASIPVMKSIQWTSFENAKKLVKAGVAEVNDFWTFVGYAGWGPGQLSGELVRKSWYMVATDSGTLLKELAKNGEVSDPRDAGLDTWNLLMNMIGRDETAKLHQGTFDDLMLKEWAFDNLLSTDTGGGGGPQERLPDSFDTRPDIIEELMEGIKGDDSAPSNLEGSLLRATSTDRSPFLLENQEFHKSVVLLIANNQDVSIGAVLNRPSSKGLDILIGDKVSGKSETVTIPLRFGGPYAVSGAEPLLWLHCSSSLRKQGIGAPVSARQEDGIWKCTQDDVVSALSKRLATVEDFIVVSGVSVWSKQGGISQGIEAELELGKFELVDQSKTNQVWAALHKQQDVLSLDTLASTLRISDDAWSAGSGGESAGKRDLLPPLSGLGENFDEEDDGFVFKSDTPVAELSDDALRKWVSTFLLGMSTS